MAALNQAKEWSAAQLQFQAWLALPPKERTPRTQQALARVLEVHETTLSDWKRLPGWGAAVYALAHAQLEHDLVPILQAQAREAKKGSLAHAQWLFDLAGKWSPKQRLEHTGKDGASIEITLELTPPSDRLGGIDDMAPAVDAGDAASRRYDAFGPLPADEEDGDAG